MLERVLALLFLLHAAAAGAQGPATNWYLLLGAGLSETKATQDLAANNATLAAQGFGVLDSREDSGATSLALGAGYRLSRNLALEVSYLDFSQLHYYSAVYTTGPNFGSQSKQWEASGFAVAAIAALPMTERLSLLAKAGAIRVKGKYRTTNVVTQPNGIVISASDSAASGSGTAPGLGLGVSYQVGPPLLLRGMYESWDAKEGTFGSGNDLVRVSLISISLVYTLP